jgi:hypothetical protein
MKYVILTFVLNGWQDVDHLTFANSPACIAVIKQLYPWPLDSKSKVQPNKVCIPVSSVSGWTKHK